MPFFKKKRPGGKISMSKKGGGKATTHTYGAQHHLLGNPSLSKGNGVTKKH